MVWIKRAAWVLGVVIVGFGAAWFAWPRPIPTDIATLALGPMEVTVDEEARTSVRHVYTVSAPVTGTLLRISNPDDGTENLSLHVGDRVVKDQTVVAVIQPVPPTLLDVRSRQELEAAVAAADAAVRLAEAEIKRMEATLQFAQEDLQRAEALSATDVGSKKALEAATTQVTVAEAGLASAQAQLAVRASEAAAALARLNPTDKLDPSDPNCCVAVRAPADGVVLAITRDSEGVTQAGTPLLQIGDPADLEVLADLLSTEAVKVAIGAPVVVDGWGGAPLSGT